MENGKIHKPQSAAPGTRNPRPRGTDKRGSWRRSPNESAGSDGREQDSGRGSGSDSDGEDARPPSGTPPWYSSTGDRNAKEGGGRGRGGSADDKKGGHRLPTKTSIGIILCRVNVASGRPEVLLVHKRYTYAFAEFVHGRFSRGRAGPAATMRSVAALLDQMTTEELLDVWSLDFEQMWYRIWLSREKRDLYNKKYVKFQSTFMRDDGGESLRRAVQQARSRGVLLWEVPKGRRTNPREPDILCGVREVREESGIDKSEYRILPGVKRRVSYVSSGTRYVCIYYVAIANPRLAACDLGSGRCPGDPGRPILREIHHMGEVSEVRWHDIERVRLIDSPDSRLESLVGPAFRLMKQYLKGRWASRRHVSPPPTAAVLQPAPSPPVSASPAPKGPDGGAGGKPAHPNDRPPGGNEEGGWRRARRGPRSRGGRSEPPAPDDRGSASNKAPSESDARPGDRPGQPGQAKSRGRENRRTRHARRQESATPAPTAVAGPDGEDEEGWRRQGKRGKK